MNITHTKTIALLVMAAVFCVLTPMLASADDTVRITNTSYASMSTGNQSSHGTDGQDGADGEDGQASTDGRDGADGQDGQASVSISNTIGGNTSATHIQSAVNGETVIDIHEVIDSTEAELTEMAVVAEANATVTASTTAEAESVKEESVTPSVVERIKNAFTSLHVIILSYVSFIF